MRDLKYYIDYLLSDTLKKGLNAFCQILMRRMVLVWSRPAVTASEEGIALKTGKREKFLIVYNFDKNQNSELLSFIEN